MNDSGKSPTEQEMDSIIGNLLRVGVFVAGTIVLIGGIFYLIGHGGEIPEYRIFHGQPVDLRTLSGILGDVVQFRARAIVQLGFLLLIATPVARVAFSVYAFARQKDLIYVIVTLFVLAVLIFSLAGGHL